MTFLRRKFKIAFLLLVVFGTYYPSIFSGVNLVDDLEVFGRLEDAAHFDLSGLVRAAGSGYYRPLTTITFYFDKALWGLEPSFMHLENIILHTLNTMLVFLIAEKVFAALNAEKYELPLLSAVLFALHPINTETVNWISGRFDLLTTSFVLMATLLIQVGLEKRQYRYFILSSSFLFIGSYAKESALFFFPAAMFLVLSSQNGRTETTAQGALHWGKTWKKISPFGMGFLFYIVCRFAFAKTADAGIKRVVGQFTHGITYDIIDTARVSLKVFGFYVKKLFIPMPLNFAIFSLNDLYLWVGLGFVIIALFFLIRRNVSSDYFLVSLFLISPAIAVAFARVAWTPVAERYLYLSSAFFSIAFIGVAFMIFKRYQQEAWITVGVFPLLFGAAFVTADRTIVWQDNLSLYEDTVRKSPEFQRIKNSLALALKDKGKFAEADSILNHAIKTNPDQVNLYINQANLRLQHGKVDEARTIILTAFKDKESANPEALKMLARIDETMLWKPESKLKRDLIATDLIQTYDVLFMKTHDALFPYRSGQLLLVLGKKQRAGQYFQRAYEAAPEGTYFKDPAKKLSEKLGATGK